MSLKKRAKVINFIILFQNKNANQINNSSARAYNWLRKRRIKGFYTEVNSESFRQGALSLMQVYLK